MRLFETHSGSDGAHPAPVIALKSEVCGRFVKFTGRGPAMFAVLGIARGHKGAPKISSDVGRGARFMVLFLANEPPDNGAPRVTGFSPIFSPKADYVET